MDSTESPPLDTVDLEKVGAATNCIDQLAGKTLDFDSVVRALELAGGAQANDYGSIVIVPYAGVRVVLHRDAAVTQDQLHEAVDRMADAVRAGQRALIALALLNDPTPPEDLAVELPVRYDVDRLYDKLTEHREAGAGTDIVHLRLDGLPPAVQVMLDRTDFIMRVFDWDSVADSGRGSVFLSASPARDGE